MVALTSLASTLGVGGIVAIPIASADTCVVTVTLVGGQTDSFTVNVPPGTPLSSIHLPVTGPVQSVSDSCTSTPTTTYASTTAHPRINPTTHPTTTTHPSTTYAALPHTDKPPSHFGGSSTAHQASSHPPAHKPAAPKREGGSFKPQSPLPRAGAGGVPVLVPNASSPHRAPAAAAPGVVHAGGVGKGSSDRSDSSKGSGNGSPPVAYAGLHPPSSSDGGKSILVLLLLAAVGALILFGSDIRDAVLRRRGEPAGALLVGRPYAADPVESDLPAAPPPHIPA